MIKIKCEKKELPFKYFPNLIKGCVYFSSMMDEINVFDRNNKFVKKCENCERIKLVDVETGDYILEIKKNEISYKLKIYVEKDGL